MSAPSLHFRIRYRCKTAERNRHLALRLDFGGNASSRSSKDEKWVPKVQEAQSQGICAVPDLEVRCDESRPKCGACTRHEVECQYANPVFPISIESATPPREYPAPSSLGTSVSELVEPEQYTSATGMPHDSPIRPLTTDPQVELRLLHHFTAFASLSISPATHVWQVQAPRLAFEYRFLFDAVMAVAALHLSREGLLRQATFPTLAAATLREISHRFLNSALRGYREALLASHSERSGGLIDVQGFEAKYLASSMISLCTLCELGNSDTGALCEEPVGEALWATLVMGTRQIVGQWKEALGVASWIHSSVYSPEPDLSSVNTAELFNPSNRALFVPLLDWASHYIMLEEEDKRAHEHTLSYLGLIYNNIRARRESPQSCCHRLRALPARVPRRYALAIVQQQPLALTILAYVYAMMKLLDKDVPWFRGVAEKQIPVLREKLPSGWRILTQWPFDVINGSDVPLTVNLHPSRLQLTTDV